MMRLPLEILAVITEGAEQVQGAANGFGTLHSCVIEVAPEKEGQPALLLTYGFAEGWSVEVIEDKPAKR